jgi:hypothetical protein
MVVENLFESQVWFSPPVSRVSPLLIPVTRPKLRLPPPVVHPKLPLAGVAAGILPAVEPGLPARRQKPSATGARRRHFMTR